VGPKIRFPPGFFFCPTGERKGKRKKAGPIWEPDNLGSSPTFGEGKRKGTKWTRGSPCPPS